jgi:hypothetical protein
MKNREYLQIAHSERLDKPVVHCFYSKIRVKNTEACERLNQ